jgi:hypothetical protein
MKLVNSFSFFLLFLFIFFNIRRCFNYTQFHSIQNEILEEFDKTSHVNGNDSAIEVNDTVDSNCSESPKTTQTLPVSKSDTTSLRRRRCNVKTTNDEEWNRIQMDQQLTCQRKLITNQF